MQTKSNPPQEVSSLTFTSDGHVQVATHKIKLSKAEYNILRYLTDRQNELVTREELVSLLWSSPQETNELEKARIYSGAINSYIYRIRRKLNSIPGSSIDLKTEYDRGYVLQVSPRSSTILTEFSPIGPGIKEHTNTVLPTHLSTYREYETRYLARWIVTGANGQIIGLKGVGKSHFVNFLCNSNRLNPYLTPSMGYKPLLLLINLADIPDDEPSTLYRTILRVFYEAQGKFEPELQTIIDTLYQQYKHERDDVATKNAIYDLIFAVQERQLRIVFFLDHFDSFLETSRSLSSLFNLNMKFRKTLCYITVTNREVSYYDPAWLGEFRTLMDTYIVRLKPLNEDDVHNMIVSEINPYFSISEEETSRFNELSGGFPTLLYAICYWWMERGRQIPSSSWTGTLLRTPNFQHRLRDIWQGLTEEEQFVLAEFGLGQGNLGASRGKTKLEQTAKMVLEELAVKGVCYEEKGQWWIIGELVAQYVKQVATKSRGRIWQDTQTGEIFQGRTPVMGLQPLQHALLQFLLSRPRHRHTHSDLIEAIWPDAIHKEGVSTEALYQIVRGIRKAIETDSSRPRYLINWRGAFEGGYQFFPEGRPE